MEFCLTKVRAPHHLLQLTNELANRGEYELLLKTASQCQLRIKEINSLAEERYCVFSSPPPPPRLSSHPPPIRLKRQREEERLVALEVELVHNRKALEDSQKERLRELKHDELVRNHLILSHEHVDPARNDSVCF